MVAKGLVTIGYSIEFAEMLRANMDGKGVLLRDVEAGVWNQAYFWSLEAADEMDFSQERAYRVTLPAGLNIWGMINFARTEGITATLNAQYPAREWRLPPLSTVWLCDDGIERTLGEMIHPFQNDWVPRSEEQLRRLLRLYGCDWTRPSEDWALMQADEVMRKLAKRERYGFKIGK